VLLDMLDGALGKMVVVDEPVELASATGIEPNFYGRTTEGGEEGGGAEDARRRRPAKRRGRKRLRRKSRVVRPRRRRPGLPLCRGNRRPRIAGRRIRRASRHMCGTIYAEVLARL
jgi:hypothetical protein